MKNLRLFGLMLIALLTAAGCQKGADDKTNTDADQAKAVEQPAPQPADAKAAGWPIQYSLDKFQPLLEHAIVKSEANVRLMGFDCADMPCIAKLVNFDKKSHAPVISAVDMWKKAYGGDVILSYSGLVVCPEGKQVRIELISPYYDGKVDPLVAEADVYEKQRLAAGERTPAERALIEKLRPRWQKIQDGWKCE